MYKFLHECKEYIYVFIQNMYILYIHVLYIHIWNRRKKAKLKGHVLQDSIYVTFMK